MGNILLIFCFSNWALAQGFSPGYPQDPSQVNSMVLRQQGQLISVQLVLGKPIRIFIVGKEEAKLDLSKLSLTVRRMNPYPGKVLKTDSSGNYFSISEPINLKEATDLEITARLQDKKPETMVFKIKPQLP